MSKIELAQDEVIKIVITQKKTGEMTIGINTGQPVDDVYIVGMLEATKNDLLNKKVTSQELVEVTLTDVDFKLDAVGELKRQGKKPGDKIKLPKPVAELRELSIKRHQENQK